MAAAYILDSNTLDHVWSKGPIGERLRERVRNVPPEKILTTDIAVEEQLVRGALAQVNSARTAGKDLVEAYAYFARTRSRLFRMNILPYDRKADEIFHTFPDYARRGKMSQDSRMAAIAIANGMIVVTENTKDFARIPGVSYTDWTSDKPEVMVGVTDVPVLTTQQKRQQKQQAGRQRRRL